LRELRQRGHGCIFNTVDDNGRHGPRVIYPFSSITWPRVSAPVISLNRNCNLNMKIIFDLRCVASRCSQIILQPRLSGYAGHAYPNTKLNFKRIAEHVSVCHLINFQIQPRSRREQSVQLLRPSDEVIRKTQSVLPVKDFPSISIPIRARIRILSDLAPKSRNRYARLGSIIYKGSAILAG